MCHFLLVCKWKWLEGPVIRAGQTYKPLGSSDKRRKMANITGKLEFVCLCAPAYVYVCVCGRRIYSWNQMCSRHLKFRLNMLEKLFHGLLCNTLGMATRGDGGSAQNPIFRLLMNLRSNIRLVWAAQPGGVATSFPSTAVPGLGSKGCLVEVLFCQNEVYVVGSVDGLISHSKWLANK